MTLAPVTLAVSGDRFVATYDLVGDVDEARPRAEAICVEQTIEFPADLVADDDIRGHVIGRLESLEPIEPLDETADGGVATTRARISYAVETSGSELPQLLNVLFGNCSLFPGVRLVGLDLPASLLARLRGPRFGVAGLRALLRVPRRPLLATALKPMGLDARALAAMAATLARGGIDIIKDDHGLANQPFAPYAERVHRVAAAVAEANATTGGHTLYLPSLDAPAHQLRARAHLAKEAGAGGLLVLPGLAGLDTMRALADDDALGLPIMAHPAFQGSFVVSGRAGIEHGLLFGTLDRLAGADLSVFPGYGGRFSFSRAACRSITERCLEPLGSIAPALPTPGGGMTLDRIPELVGFYGDDVTLLIGGNLHRGDLLTNVQRMHEVVETAPSAAPGLPR